MKISHRCNGAVFLNTMYYFTEMTYYVSGGTLKLPRSITYLQYKPSLVHLAE